VGNEAYVIYKPHPDVLAGHRRGAIADHDLAELADHVETTSPIAALIAMVDELHVNSSLAGFEALMRGKPVTVHGVPFYAGWGLTTDLGPVPARRIARRTLDELIAATLLLYPRYLDPETGLPCPAEVLVERLTSMTVSKLNWSQRTIVMGRRLQGRLRARLGSPMGKHTTTGNQN
jgi:capsular polysaccharide export protein